MRRSNFEQNDKPNKSGIYLKNRVLMGISSPLMTTLKRSLRWFFPFIMISFVMLAETWVFESIRGDWTSIISKTVTFSAFNLGFFLGVTLGMCLVISRHKGIRVESESRLYGFSFLVTLVYILLVFPNLFVDTESALNFISTSDSFAPHEVEYFRMFSISWIIELSSITWFLILVMRGDSKAVTISRFVAILVKVVLYLALAYGTSYFKDEKMVLLMAYTTIALRVVEYLCYMIYSFVKHRSAVKYIHQVFRIPKKDYIRLAKASLLLINPLVYNFALFLSWKFVYSFSSSYLQIIAVILPLFKMILNGGVGLSHCIPSLIMDRMAKKEYDSVYKHAKRLSKASLIIGAGVGLLTFITIIVLATTQTFNASGIDPDSYYNSLLTLGGFYCLLCPMFFQTDTLSTIMMSGGKTRGHTFLNVFVPLLAVIALGITAIFVNDVQAIWWIVGAIFIVNLKALIGFFFNNWKFKFRKEKWLKKVN